MHVLLATDGSVDGNAAIDILLEVGPGSEMRVMVLAVAPSMSLLGSDLEAPPGVKLHDQIDVARAIADSVCKRLQSAGIDATPMVRHGKPAEEILAAARETEPGLVALGIRGVGRVRRFVAGSVASAVARFAPAPVLLVNDPASLSTALIATDGSSGSEQAIAAFIKMPKSPVERAVVLHVGDEEPGSEARADVVDAALRQMQDVGIGVEQRRESGNEVEAILRVAAEEEATVIVLGASRTRVDGEPLLGSTANGVINRAPCSILIGR